FPGLDRGLVEPKFAPTNLPNPPAQAPRHRPTGCEPRPASPAPDATALPSPWPLSYGVFYVCLNRTLREGIIGVLFSDLMKWRIKPWSILKFTPEKERLTSNTFSGRRIPSISFSYSVHNKIQFC